MTFDNTGVDTINTIALRVAQHSSQLRVLDDRKLTRDRCSCSRVVDLVAEGENAGLLYLAHALRYDNVVIHRGTHWVDQNVDEYLQDAEALVMSPHANVSDQTEVPRLSSLDTNVLVRDDDSRPAWTKVTFAQKAARRALERQEKERCSKSRRLNQ